MLITRTVKNIPLLGINNKNLNKRVLSYTNLDNSILVIDLSYYSILVSNKLKHNNIFKERWDNIVSNKSKLLALLAIDSIFEPIIKLKRLVSIQHIILLCQPFTQLTDIEKTVFNLFTSIINSYVICNKFNIISSLYSMAVDTKEKYIILSDNLDFWSICSKKSKIVFCIITKNNNIRLYIDKFGLEYLSSLIGTNKLVNKLRLSKLKYVNLQYLFILLLYTKFKYTKANKIFDLSDPSFLGAKGRALEILCTSHREISYFFLTKSDIIDIFLTSSATHFVLNLSRLLKILDVDVNFMSSFANYYANTSVKYLSITQIFVENPVYEIMKRSKVYSFKEMPKTTPSSKKDLSKNTEIRDIQSIETSDLVSSILRGLSW